MKKIIVLSLISIISVIVLSSFSYENNEMLESNSFNFRDMPMFQGGYGMMSDNYSNNSIYYNDDYYNNSRDRSFSCFR